MKYRKTPSQKRGLLRRRGVWVAIIMLLLAGSGAAWYFLRGPGAARQAAQASPASFSIPVQRGDIRLSASGSGTLVASREVDLSFSTGGTVAELNVKVGDMVTAGDELARLGNALDLEANLASARLQLLEAQQALVKLQQGADISLAQAYQELVAAQEAYADAQTTVQRLAYGRCSREVRTRYAEALERAQQKLDGLTLKDYGSDLWIDAKNDYDTALANFNYCAAYSEAEKTQAQAKLTLAAAGLKQAEDTYATLKDASGIYPDALVLAEEKVAAAEKQLASAQEDLDGIVLTAPIDGKVTYVAAGQGEIVGTQTFITIADVSHPTIQLSVDETDLDKLVVGAAVQVTFDALKGQTFNGAVVRVDPQMTASGPYGVATGLVTLDEEAARVVQNLPLGLSASVTLIIQEAKDVLLVPAAALQETGDGEYAVMVIGSDGQMTLQAVQVGLQNDEYAEILSGLEEGQMINAGLSRGSSGSASGSGDEMMFPMDGGIPMPGGGGMPPGGGMP